MIDWLIDTWQIVVQLWKEKCFFLCAQTSGLEKAEKQAEKKHERTRTRKWDPSHTIVGVATPNDDRGIRSEHDGCISCLGPTPYFIETLGDLLSAVPTQTFASKLQKQIWDLRFWELRKFSRLAVADNEKYLWFYSVFQIWGYRVTFGNRNRYEELSQFKRCNWFQYATFFTYATLLGDCHSIKLISSRPDLQNWSLLL